MATRVSSLVFLPGFGFKGGTVWVEEWLDGGYVYQYHHPSRMIRRSKSQGGLSEFGEFQELAVQME